MSRQTIGLDPALHDYLLSVSVREPDVARRLREETAAMPQASMQIAPEQGQLMALLVRLTGARRVLEIGTFTGYSALIMARALPTDGTILACDVSAEWTAIARRYWREAGVEAKIDLRLAPALDTVAALIADRRADGFDFIFIDADKENYDAYYEAALTLARPGGLIAIDNVLWGGSVANEDDRRPMTLAIRALNAKLKDDARIDLSLVPIGDGLTLARKR